MRDGDREERMSSESSADRGGTGLPTEQTTDAMEQQLRDALDSDDGAQARYHVRQALQLIHALDE